MNKILKGAILSLLVIMTCLGSLAAMPEASAESALERAAELSGSKNEMLEYCESLVALGFPRDYAEGLTLLHAEHPSWTFTPLMISELNTTYTWSYIMYKEGESAPRRNLVSPNPEYAPYRSSSDKGLYDSGWYQASNEAVAYFMDPRNFMNEKDIFQFRNLKYNESNASLSAIEEVLKGSFMSGAKLSNGKTYAEYLLEIGRELDVDPIQLASRLRCEQGVRGGSPLISGACGDQLAYYYANKVQWEDGKQVLTPSKGYTQSELKSYNGLYNYYNIGACGNGNFAIYLSAIKEAEKGSSSMAEAWGGSGAWDTDWKAIYGGALQLKNAYTDNYQNTVYLQKFNVDPRASRNFWGQYMQNISAARSESRTLYKSAVDSGLLELPYNFLIPVYSGMPEECPDPASKPVIKEELGSGSVGFESHPDIEGIVGGSVVESGDLIFSFGGCDRFEGSAAPYKTYGSAEVTLPPTESDMAPEVGLKPTDAENESNGEGEQIPNGLLIAGIIIICLLIIAVLVAPRIGMAIKRKQSDGGYSATYTQKNISSIVAIVTIPLVCFAIYALIWMSMTLVSNIRGTDSEGLHHTKDPDEYMQLHGIADIEGAKAVIGDLLPEALPEDGEIRVEYAYTAREIEGGYAFDIYLSLRFDGAMALDSYLRSLGVADEKREFEYAKGFKDASPDGEYAYIVDGELISELYMKKLIFNYETCEVVYTVSAISEGAEVRASELTPRFCKRFGIKPSPAGLQ